MADSEVKLIKELQEIGEPDAHFFAKGLAAVKGLGYGLIIYVGLKDSLLAGVAILSTLSVVELYYTSAVSELESIRQDVMKTPEPND